jgi:YesN/AraC family two-component response regulator
VQNKTLTPLQERLFTLLSFLSKLTESAPPFPGETLISTIPQLTEFLSVEELQCIILFLEKLCDLLPSAETAIPKPLSINEKRILKINAYLEENYRKNIRLSDIARHIGLSKEALCSFYKKHTSRTLSSYLNEIRIEASAQMLRETDDSISGIAYSCGFNTIHYFNKTFKQSKGMTPAEYRKMIQS